MFALGTALVAGVVFGILPAFRLSRPDIQNFLRDGIRNRAAGGVIKAGAPLVAAEVALGLMLLTGTGLMVNTLVRMRTVDLGFNPTGLVTMSFGLPEARYPTPRHRYDHYIELIDRLRRQPEVRSVAAIDIPQNPGYAPPTGLRKGLPERSGLWSVTAGYFATVGLPIVHGRDFTDAEVRADAPVVVINEAVAQFLWPDAPALGRTLKLEDVPPLTVIGVVRDVRPGYGAAVRPSVYRPFGRDRFRWMTIVARGSGDPLALATIMRTDAQRMDPALIIPRPQQLVDVLNRDMADTTFQTSLFVLFGLLGVVVAAVGIYGVIGYWVGARTHEMGVRLALGASPEQLKRLVVRQASVPLIGGLVLGIVGAFALSRRLESLLYGITPHDPATFAFVFLFLLVIGLAAAYVPARRAARVDPMVALRGE